MSRRSRAHRKWRSVDHYNIRRVIDIYAIVQGRDLGAVGARHRQGSSATRQDLLPRGSFVTVRGQLETMRASYVDLLGGLAFSIVLVYLLIVVNFQSWLDPFIIITALPAALAGIVLFLFFTGTTLSVPALMGAIMCMGVATANSILVVSFAREQLAEHGDAVRAAIEAGFTRFRPVLMTALAMIIGMVPMALGAGRGRRAERAARPRGHRRPDAGDRRHPGFRSDCFFPVAFPQGWRRDAAAASGYIGGAREFGGVMLEKTDGVKTPAPIRPQRRPIRQARQNAADAARLCFCCAWP